MVRIRRANARVKPAAGGNAIASKRGDVEVQGVQERKQFEYQEGLRRSLVMTISFATAGL
jgi:hypothetical protein